MEQNRINIIHIEKIWEYNKNKKRWKIDMKEKVTGAITCFYYL